MGAGWGVGIRCPGRGDFGRGGERGERGRVWPLGNIRLVTRRVILRCSDLNLICVWRGSGRLLGRDGGVVGWVDGGVWMEGYIRLGFA